MATYRLVEVAESSDSELEDRRANQASQWHPDSDSDSIDSEGEDVFKWDLYEFVFNKK